MIYSTKNGTSFDLLAKDTVNVCTFLQDGTNPFITLFLGSSPITNCPIPKGTYRVENKLIEPQQNESGDTSYTGTIKIEAKVTVVLKGILITILDFMVVMTFL